MCPSSPFGKKDGRTFLVGVDGCLYEMCYKGPEKKKKEKKMAMMNSKESIETVIEGYFDGEGGVVGGPRKERSPHGFVQWKEERLVALQDDICTI
jgi:hypothetical protein